MYRHPVYSDRKLPSNETGAASYEKEGPAEPEAASIMRLDRCMGRQALHAASLTLMHPIEGSTMVFTAPLPEDMNSLRNVLAEEAT